MSSGYSQWGYAIGAGLAGMWNGLRNGGSADEDAEVAFARQAELLRRQQDWTERMSNTAHQREVADLKSAGLNPILSANNGASTQTVSAPGVNMSQSSNRFSEAMQTGMNAVLQNRAMNIQQQQTNQDIKESNEKIDLMNSEKGLNEINQKVQLATQSNIIADTIRKQIENEYLPKQQKQILANMEQEYRKMGSEMQVNAITSANLITQKDLINAQIDVAQTEAKRQQIENRLLSIEEQRARKEKGWVTRHPIQTELQTGLGRWTGAIGNIFSGSAHIGGKRK